MANIKRPPKTSWMAWDFDLDPPKTAAAAAYGQEMEREAAHVYQTHVEHSLKEEFTKQKSATTGQLVWRGETIPLQKDGKGAQYLFPTVQISVKLSQPLTPDCHGVSTSLFTSSSSTSSEPTTHDVEAFTYTVHMGWESEKKIPGQVWYCMYCAATSDLDQPRCTTCLTDRSLNEKEDDDRKPRKREETLCASFQIDCKSDKGGYFWGLPMTCLVSPLAKPTETAATATAVKATTAAMAATTETEKEKQKQAVNWFSFPKTGYYLMRWTSDHTYPYPLSVGMVTKSPPAYSLFDCPGVDFANHKQIQWIRCLEKDVRVTISCNVSNPEWWDKTTTKDAHHRPIQGRLDIFSIQSIPA
jgi:hypothetical protein